MFRLTQLVALAMAAGSVVASPARRDTGLVVTVTSNGDSIKSVDDLVLTAKVENTGAEDVKVLKFATVLDDTHPTRSFKVTKGGEDVAFTGVKMQIDLERADDSAYTVIPAGASVEVKHNVASVFDFATAGTGAFDFAPTVNFRAVAAGEGLRPVDRLVSVGSSSHSVSVDITGDVAKRHLLPKRAVVQCDDSSRASFIQSSYDEAKELATVASDYISGGGGTLYDDYFSSNSQSTVGGNFDSVIGENSSSRGLYCTDPHDVCTGGVIAYMLIATTEIYFCDIFFDEVAHPQLCSGGTTVESRNIRGGTTLHELTHAVSGTDDINYGCPGNQALSASEQVINADNYNCFATEVYAEQC
ncbi:Metalloprotease [Pterulicium gracile]|uniref:Neutral protease 2 n=1 Tax=Pterulicium gracile TaxID=1884261 RepID=A0A5C3QAI9_9AGAR|nr:Metalloprotease [Pterula gracilis]